MKISSTSTISEHRNLNMQPLAHAASLSTTPLAAAAMTRWPACGEVEVVLAPRGGSPIRRAYLRVSIGAFVYRGTCWVAHFREVDAPQGVEPAAWSLVSSGCLRHAEDALALLRSRPDLVIGVLAGDAQMPGASDRSSSGRLSHSTARDRPKGLTGDLLPVFANEITHAILST